MRVLTRQVIGSTGFEGPLAVWAAGTVWYDEAGNVIPDPFGTATVTVQTNNPVSTLGAVVMVIGIILLIAGICLAVHLKGRSRDDRK